MARRGRLSLQSRLLLVVLVMLLLCAASLAAVLNATYDRQLQGIARDRLQRDLPLVRSDLDELRTRDLRLAELAASNAELAAATDRHDAAALDKILGSLRAQMSPVANILAVVDPKGHTIGTDPFTELNFSNDQPVKDALQGRRDLNLVNTKNSLFFVRNAYPALSVETAWPVRLGAKTAGAVVLLNAVADDTFNSMLAPAGFQGGVVAVQQRALLAGNSQLRQLQQRQKLGPVIAGLDRVGTNFMPIDLDGQPYYFLVQPFATQPVQTRLLLAVPGKNLAAGAMILRRQLLTVVLIALVILAAVAFLLLRLVLHPIRQLRRAAEQVRRGETLAAVPKASPPEIQDIADVLSGLASDLAAALDAERGQRTHIEAIIDSMAEGVVVSDVNRRVTLLNPVAKRLLGINGTDGATALIPLHVGELAADSKMIKSRSAPIIAEDGQTTGYVTLLHDASEEGELDRLKSEFVGIVSHELRTPLTSIKGSVDLLLDDETGDLNGTQRRFLHTIRRSSDRLINLVNDLLDLSRLEAGRVQLDVHPVDAGHLVEDTVNSLGNLFAARKQEIQVLAEADLPPILADRQRIEQVLVNLLGNASKYTPEHGELRVSAQRAGNRVVIDVADTGPGLSLQDAERVFEKFYRAGDSLTQQQQTGSGLGLTIARSLVELHGGTLAVHSEPGHGATFSVSLPAYEEEE